MGSDDAWALLMLLQAEKHMQNYKIIGITCVHGNTTMQNVIRNTVRILEDAGRGDVPIYEGAHEALIPGPPFPTPFHGFDGMGDLVGEHAINTQIEGKVRPGNAVEAINKLVIEHPKQVTLVCVGPLTNVALALTTYQGLSEQIEEIFIMGGNYHGIGNTSRCAEFNFYTDPEAANIVLHRSKCPVTILPWEACLEENLNITMDWRLNVVGSVNSDVVKLLNVVERKCYSQFDTWMPCDAWLTAAFLFPDKCIQKKRQCHVTVELAGHYTRGQVVIDHLKTNTDNVTIIDLLCENSCKEAILWTVDPEVTASPA